MSTSDSRFRSILGGPLLLPALGIWLLLFAVPLLVFCLTSLSDSAGNLSSLSLQSYERFLGSSFYINVLARTVVISIETSLLTLILGYPAAYMISKCGRSLRKILLLLSTAPLLISAIINLYGWLVIFSPDGPVNVVLRYLGFVDGPVRFIYTQPVLMIGMVSMLLPFMIINVVNGLVGINSVLVEAAVVHGAGRFHTFLRVTLPLSLQGIVSGVLLVFTIAMSAYVIPLILGGPTNRMVGNLVFDSMSNFEWPFAASVAVILVLTTLCICACVIAISRERWRAASY